MDRKVIPISAIFIVGLSAYIYYKYNKPVQVKRRVGLHTFEEIKAMATEECKGVEKSPKDPETFTFSPEYTLQVFYLLTKYVAMAKMSAQEDSFWKRIKLLDNGDEADYREFKSNEEVEETELAKRIKEHVF